MDIKLHLKQQDSKKYKFLVFELQLLSLMFHYEKHLKKIKIPESIHIDLFGEKEHEGIVAGGKFNPAVCFPINISVFNELSIDDRLKKILSILKKSFKLTCDYLKSEDEIIESEGFEKIYQKLIKINYNDFIPIHTVNIPKKNEQVDIEISLLKKKVTVSLLEEKLLKFRIDLVPYVYHPMDYFFFFKPFSFHAKKGNILSLKSKKILLCFNLINHNWFFKKRGKTPIPLEEKEELIFVFLDFEQDKQGYLNKCKELNDEEFLAYVNDEIMTLMI